MQTDTPEWRALLNEVAYSLIREQAPEELPLYTRTRDRYFADPSGFTSQPTSVDRPLGMGATELVQLFTTSVFPLLTPVLVAIATSVATSLQQDVTEQIIAKVRSIFAQPEPLFTQAQLEAIEAEVGAVIRSQQKQLKLEPAQAQAVKLAIVARLALAKSDR